MKHTIKQAKQMLGIMDALITHVVEKTEADIKWTGPKINREQWEEMLAFFKWTYDLNRSESQVRLFVNQDKWAIWAFPQKANTGMTAIELETEDTVKQRDMFREPDGWHYFGTVHSHCSTSAFQSGVDIANEQKVDGLHITIGHLDQDRYDLHARLMIGGLTIAPNLSWFWDVGEIADQLPVDMHHQIARFQMTKAISKDAKFPQQWRDNYIEVKPVVTPMIDRSYGYGNGSEHRKELDGCKLAHWKIKKVEKAMDDFGIDLFQRGHNMEEKEWFDVVLDLAEMDHEFLDLIKAMGKEDVVWEDVMTLAEFLNEAREKKRFEKELEEEEAALKAELGESPEEVDEAVDSIRKLQAEMEAEGGKSEPDEAEAAKFYEAEAERKRKEQLEIQEELIRRAYGFD